MSADKASSTQARRACSEELSSELPTRCFVIPESNADVTETQTVEENNASASTSASAVMHEGSISMKPQETEHSESSTKCGIDITTDGVESSNLQVNDSKAVQNETEQLMEDGEITETGNDKKEHKCKKKHGHKCSKHKVKNANEKQVTEDAHCPSKSRHKHKNKHKHKHKHSRDGDGEKKSKSKDRASKANSGKRRSGSSERHNKSQKEDERHKREGSFWRGYSQLPDVVSSARTKETSRAKRARADDSEDDDAFWGGFTPREGWRSPSPAKDIAACDFLPVEQIPLPPRRAAAAYTSEPRCKKIEIRMTSKAGPDRYSSLSTAPESASHSWSEKRPGADPALKFLTSLCKTISERDREEELRTRGRRKNDVTRTRFDREPAQGSRFRTDILAGTNVAGPRADGNAAVPPWLMPAHKQVAIARANQDALKQQFPISTGEEHKVVIENFSTDTVEPQAEDSDLDAIQQTRKHTEMDRRIRETLGQFTKHRLLYLPEQEVRIIG